VAKVKFPRETVPASVVTVQLATFLVLLVGVVPVAIALRGAFDPALLLLVPLVVCLYVFILGVSLAVAVLHAHFRDVQPILAAVLLPWFFITPIFFRLSDLPGLEGHHWAEVLLRWANPVAPFIEAIRAVLYDGRAPHWDTLVYVLVASAVALLGGRAVFKRLERELAVVL
jgi:ABC-type polysaccharide/polyol phosphate export permease